MQTKNKMHEARPLKSGEKKCSCTSFDALTIGIQENDCEGRITYSNRAHHDILGYDFGELLGRNIWDTQPTDDEKHSLKSYFEKLKTEQPTPVPFQTTNLRQDGTVVQLRIDWSYIRDADGILSGFVSIIMDISDHRQKEAALAQFTRSIETMLEVSKRLVSTLDMQQVLQAAVDGVTRLAGLDTAAIYLFEGEKLHLWAATPPLPSDFPDSLRTIFPDHNPHLAAAVASGEPVLVPDALNAELTQVEKAVVEERNLRTLLFLPLIAESEALGALIVGSIGKPTAILDDQIRLTLTFANLAAMAAKNARLYKAGRRYASELEQSLADRERAEAEREILRRQLFQVQKMEAVGQLAGGVAHDFNNQLGGIMGYAELIESAIEDDRLKQFATHIVTLAKRSADLTAQLLAFARKGQFQTVEVDLHKIIDEVASMLAHTIHRKIVIRKEFEAAESRTSGDPTQIQSALLNLAVNARDAMQEGGLLTFHTKRIRLEGESCKQRSIQLQQGEYIRLCVSDSGVGMDDATMERIFEPFFTTKEPGRGTGMGLAAVYGTMKTHGGGVSVESTPGRGSTFKLYFPIIAGAPVDEIPKETVTGTRLHKEILFVDDEETAAQAAAEHLKHAGYTVHFFTDSAAALAYFENNYAQLSLIILDMILPNMGGPELFRTMKSIHPEVRVLIASGFSIDKDIQALLDKGAAFIQKPFLRDELLKAVRRRLEA